MFEIQLVNDDTQDMDEKEEQSAFAESPKVDRKYQVMPDMPPDQFEALKKDIADRGVITPIDLDEEGNILDGHHRVRACHELGITDYPTIIRPGLSEEEKRLFARKSNMMRRHLNRKQIRDLIKRQLMDTPRWANNRIAGELGVDSKTVGKIREKLEATLEIPKFDKLLGTDGKERYRIYKKAVMVPNEEARNQVLKMLKEAEVDIESLPDEFMECQQFIVMQAPEPTEEERKVLEEWDLFYTVMQDEYKIQMPAYPNWIIRKFDDPADFVENWWAWQEKFLGGKRRIRKKPERIKDAEQAALKRVEELRKSRTT